jgi:hypothetical protein
MYQGGETALQADCGEFDSRRVHHFKNKENKMIGQYLYHKLSDTIGYVDAEAVHPDGKALVRINDRWFMTDNLIAG